MKKKGENSKAGGETAPEANVTDFTHDLTIRTMEKSKFLSETWNFIPFL